MKRFASIYNLYQKGKAIPAFNLRVLVYDSSRALFRVAKKLGKPLFIIELAQSEMVYTKQSPKRFSKDILKAAKAENYQSPIYLQGDHYKPIGGLEELIQKSIKAGFYNIDIDCSAFALPENIEKTNYYINFINKVQPKNITINIGAEVGDIGGRNTEPNDLEEFLCQVRGIGKIAVQTGTAHGKGGQIDWELLNNLAQIARKHGLPGVVQHGASTLSEQSLKKLSQYGVCEVHLATEIMETILEHPAFPYKVSKQEIGAYQKKIDKMPQKIKDEIMQALEQKYIYFFQELSAVS